MLNCKKMISLLLSLIMILSVFSIVPFGAAAAQAETDDASIAEEPEGEPAAQEEPVPEEPVLSQKAEDDLASTGNEYGGFYYDIYGGAATITGYVGADTDVVIPSVINGYTVTRIGEWAFSDNDSIESVTVPDTVTEIGDGAFDSCDNLTTVTFAGNAVKIIGSSAFCGCVSLVNFQLPPAQEYLGSYALQNTVITSEKIKLI